MEWYIAWPGVSLAMGGEDAEGVAAEKDDVLGVTGHLGLVLRNFVGSMQGRVFANFVWYEMRSGAQDEHKKSKR